MLWRSVVGKLWMTILALVALVLAILTILLLQFFDRYYTDQAKSELTSLADQVATLVDTYGNHQTSRKTAWKLLNAHSTEGIIVGPHGKYWSSPSQTGLPHLSFSEFKNDQTLSQVIKNEETITKMGEFPVKINDKVQEKTVLIVGIPIHLNDGNGAIYLYQSLNVIHHTTEQAKKLIFISAGIAIILTTVFAFFLSTRITSPLRKMRQAALEVAKGRFDIEVPELTKDEIGELAATFNRMGRQLQGNLNALNQEKEQLSSILSSMADGVLTLNRNGDVLVSNPPAQRFLYAWMYEHPDQAVGTIPDDVRHIFKNVVTEEKEQVAETTVQGRSWVVVMTPLYGGSNVSGAVAVLRDMTDERRLDKLREDFVANVSHELRTPVSMLQGYSEAIVDDIAQSEEEKKEIAQIIYEESQRMGRLVNDLLDLTRMETDHFQLHKENVELRPFFQRIIRKFQGIATERDVDLSLVFQTEDHEQMAFDQDHIEQVLTNLIDNAIRHSEKGGTVTVHVETAQAGMTVFVDDTGSGIPEEDIPYVFERFYKADKARTRGKSGTGLGLAIAKNLVESHNGTITVHSTQGKGTTFRFFLPRMQN